MAVFPFEEIVPPLLVVHAKDALGVVEEPFNVAEVVVQVRAKVFPAFTFGAVVFEVTSATSVAEQPPVAVVTVRV